MHDGIFDHDLPIERRELLEIASAIGLDAGRFAEDLESDVVRSRVARYAHDASENGVTGTPTLFVDGIRYDGAWDFDSMLRRNDVVVLVVVHGSDVRQ